MIKHFIFLSIFSSLLLAQDIFNYSFKYTGDINNNLNGGIKKGSVYMGNAHLNINLNTSFLGLEKGNLNVDIMNSLGNKFSENYVGDMQTLSNIENDNTTMLYEFWYSYNFDKLSLKAGYIDLNSDFILMSSAENFLNSSLQVFPALSLNYPLSIFPRPFFGVHFDYRFTDNKTLRVAYFDVEEVDSYKKFVNTKLFKSGIYNLISEFQNNIDDKLNYKVGVFYQNKQEKYKNCLSYYLGLNYTIWENSNIFGQISFCDRNIVSPYYFAFGFTKSNIFGRENDIFGLSYGYASLFKQSNEAFVEAYYIFQIVDFMYIQPDFQYIINPSGNGINDATVFNLRIGVEL